METIKGYMTSSLWAIGENPELLWCKQLPRNACLPGELAFTLVQIAGHGRSFSRRSFVSKAADRPGTPVKNSDSLWFDNMPASTF